MLKGFVLTKEQLSDLNDAHQKAKRSSAHAAYKINAIIFLGTGWTLKQVRQALLLDGETLRSYVKKYHEHGIESLIRTHYKGRTSKLAEAQEDQLRVVTRLNLHGALHAETHEVTVIESATVSTDSTIQLIEILDQKYFLAKEIILIADNAKYHYSKKVQALCTA